MNATTLLYLPKQVNEMRETAKYFTSSIQYQNVLKWQYVRSNTECKFVQKNLWSYVHRGISIRQMCSRDAGELENQRVEEKCSCVI